ncbi:hypothetical protein ACFVMC_30930 [Nocardia sp. NPDC127579]|uniref:hypothetical protein n=1 Tax=Nocardia sp. NPDC127579 TaxID=3345402 RepID=UPI0036358923
MWTNPFEVPDDTGVALQLTLMETYADGEMTRADFVAEWLEARQQVADANEPVGGDLADLLDSVTSDVEDYAANPRPEPDDPSEDPLREDVHQARNSLGHL